MFRGFWKRLRPSSRLTPEVKSSLDELESRCGASFPNLRKAREASVAKLEKRKDALASMRKDDRASVVYAGSIGRMETVDGSDDDFMLLLDTTEDPRGYRAGIESVREILRELDDFVEPGGSGVFAKPVSRQKLIQHIGLEADDNANTTRRMLFLIESRPAWNESFYEESMDLVLDRYLDDSVKDHRPPRFLLNDLIRYWRTMCVDFAGKEKQGPEKWGIRNAKLRTSRKLLFAGGLLPVLTCQKLPKAAMKEFLRGEFSNPPCERIAAAFLEANLIDPAERTIKAYDDFLGILNSPEKRKELERLERDRASSSELFQEVKNLGKSIESGLLSYLFAPGDHAALSKDYLIF